MPLAFTRDSISVITSPTCATPRSADVASKPARTLAASLIVYCLAGCVLGAGLVGVCDDDAASEIADSDDVDVWPARRPCGTELTELRVADCGASPRTSDHCRFCQTNTPSLVASEFIFITASSIAFFGVALTTKLLISTYLISRLHTFGSSPYCHVHWVMGG